MRRLSSRIPIKGRKYSLAYRACGPLSCNTFALICEATKEALVIDPSTHDPPEFEALQQHLDGAEVKKILLTHGHPDHVAGVPDAIRTWPRSSLHIHSLEMENYNTAAELAPRFDLKVSDLPEPTDALKDKEMLRVGESIELQVLHTPGHAPGHVSFLDRRISPGATENRGAVVVGGDLLFRGSVGRTDFPNSSIDDLYASLRRLYEEVDDESIVLTGHTTPTYLKIEREKNAFVASALQRPIDWYQEARNRNGWE